ncbi:NADH dehydrogenase subunit 4 [Campylobacter hominis ATCC BAA-381]|uniref:NADH dehydrogenase subunit 4 n=1 Tax=Campylobacter hominis (strain ATCC BAA-381 / DSM 21671 / CCUG 45161 / LMG 19568 / NCTC 13146 / CH001A) TaxID=360107 RepID=A7I422_CAMHC|nr:NADH dehydrogenase subunit 4 [Campylobacter hominis ATCC BAA-381]
MFINYSKQLFAFLFSENSDLRILINKNSAFMLKFNSIKLKILVLSFILLYFLKSAHLKFNYFSYQFLIGICI